MGNKEVEGSRSARGMNQKTHDIAFYSAITIWLCILLAALRVPVEGLVIIALICIGMIVVSSYREKGSGGPK